MSVKHRNLFVGTHLGSPDSERSSFSILDATHWMNGLGP